MGTYFHGSSEIQADGLQTLYLMNPNFVGYSDTQPQQGNMLFLNSAAGHALSPASVTHAPPSQHHHFVGVPLPAAIGSDDPTRQSMSFHNTIPRFHYNLWNDQTAAAAAGSVLPSAVVGGGANSGGSTDFATQLGFRRPTVAPAKQGLSLSLSPQQPAYRPVQVADQDNPVGVISPRSGPGEGFRGSGGHSSSSVSAISNGISGVQSMILGSKYLQAAQELLDEVVNVRNRVKSNNTEEGIKEKMKMNKETVGVSDETPSGGNKNGTKIGAELTTAERQELQMKKAKLVSMLDEVEQRYRQYHHQMQVVVTSFEQAAGLGSAKSYTSLALQTISKQFRCLKDAISTQIKGASKSLGEDDPTEGKPEGSRLKFVDHQLRQQRALQQLGMMQHNAWRPQRGLPERAVSVLRAWLFEHFLHPYPKDSDKHMLAKQTGLTRSQVSNWFINARVRLWKPMVEEMYMEEFKEQEQNPSASAAADPNTTKAESNKNPNTQDFTTLQNDQISPQKNPNPQNTSPNEISTSAITTSPTITSLQAHQAKFSLIGSSTSPKKPRNELQNSPNSILSVEMDAKPGDQRSKRLEPSRDSYHLLAGSASNGGGFGDYTLGELGRYNPEQFATGFHGNGVSLTLGLPHGENSLSLSEAHQNYLSDHTINQFGSRHDMGGVENHFNGINPPQGSHSNMGYENMNIQSRKRFAAQLLHDFVA